MASSRKWEQDLNWLVPLSVPWQQRCPADGADQQGVTTLHVAAEKGAIEVSWLLLQEAGLNGLTPLDLCRHGTTFRCVCASSQRLRSTASVVVGL
ncbi:hypothetical protein AAFF_G00139490 [Aldrovandia affinis]|uniref:Uncharacterized protein n=1 Tax=Aldrovandia affinis TaxID=143900 RepID=A0AAD7TC82_9TELE|nr:hypothetical protein AAFF_G00139490 [Aldrovandia affinis]